MIIYSAYSNQRRVAREVAMVPTNSNYPRGLRGGIVENALPNLIVEMGAIVIRLYRCAVRFIGVGMEGIQVCANALHGREILHV